MVGTMKKAKSDTVLTVQTMENEVDFLRHQVAEMRSALDKYQCVVSNSPDGILIIDESGRPLFASPSVTTILGYDQAEIKQLNLFELIHPEDVPAMQDLMISLMKKPGKAQRGAPRRYKHKNGSWKWVHATNTNLLDNPAISGILEHFQDVTHSRMLIEEMVMANERFERVVEATNDAIWEWDLQTDTLMWGDNYKRKYGAKLAEFLTMDDWRKRVHPADISAVEDSLQRAIQSKQQRSWQAEYRYRRADGQFSFVADRSSIIREPAGKAIRMVGALQDVTKAKQAQMQKNLINEISNCFTQFERLKDAMDHALRYVLVYTDYQMAEIWLPDHHLERVKLMAHASLFSDKSAFIENDADLVFEWGQGLPGHVAETKKFTSWGPDEIERKFRRKEAAERVGLRRVNGVPLIGKQNKLIGILIVGSHVPQSDHSFDPNWEELGKSLGSNIMRKQMEQELGEIFSTAPDVLCIAGLDGYFKKVNPAMSVLLGYSEKELLSQPFSHFVHPEDRSVTADELNNLSHGRFVFAFENRYVTKTGKIVWLSWTCTSIPQDDVIYGVARDVTNRKYLEDLLKRATTLAQVGSWEMDLRSNKLFWSPMTRKMHGLTEDEPIHAQTAKSLIHKDFKKHVLAAWQHVIASGEPFDEEIKIVTKQGEEKWVRLICEVTYLDKVPVYLTGSFQDIHHRKLAEEAAIKSLQERNSILDRIDEAFFAVDENWIVTYWNKKAEKLIGKSKKELLGKSLWEVFPEYVDSPSFRYYHKARQTKTAVHFEDHYAANDFWLEISAYPSESGLSVFFKDITSRKRAEIELLELNAKLERHAQELAASNKELEQFAYVASHDLQEPLRTVTSFLTQLENRYAGELDEKGMLYIKYAVDGAKRMRQIILDLLEFSRVGRNEEQYESIDLDQLVKDVVSLNRAKIKELGARVIIGKMPIINGLTMPMQQIFQNLLSNALKYHSPERKPIIKISCRSYANHWRIEVADNGLGIDPEYAERIFQIFQRLHRRDEYPGTGMGLAITRKMVEHMGGQIHVKPNAEVGSVFYFTIPKK